VYPCRRRVGSANGLIFGVSELHRLITEIGNNNQSRVIRNIPDRE